MRSGVPEKTAMRISGHKTRAVFDRYDIQDERDVRVAADKLDAYHRWLEAEHAKDKSRTNRQIKEHQA